MVLSQVSRRGGSFDLQSRLRSISAYLQDPSAERLFLHHNSWLLIPGLDEENLTRGQFALVHKNRGQQRQRLGVRQLFAQSHPRQWVDRSGPAYNERERIAASPTHGSGWIVQVLLIERREHEPLRLRCVT